MGTGNRWAWTDPLILYYNHPLTSKKLGAICIERDTPADADYKITDGELYRKLHAYERGKTHEVPSYNKNQWGDSPKLAPERIGGPSDAGPWRIEVYPAAPAKRDYFFHVMRIQRTPKDEPGNVTYHDAADRAEARMTLRGRTYAVSFAKTGKVGGHIRIIDAEGKVVADRDFAQKILQKDWPNQYPE